jgi:uncharacterized protein
MGIIEKNSVGGMGINMVDDAIIVFVKNPILGKVKTRLAQDIGEAAALNIYLFLLRHTADTLRQIGTNVHKFIFFSDFIPESVDFFDKNLFYFRQQRGGTLGERMYNAFEDIFALNYKNVVIIGSDCYDLRPKHILHAFDILRPSIISDENKHNYKKNVNFALGAATDGGYYLLGMRQLFRPIFFDKQWSTHTVLADTLADIARANLHADFIDTLNDIDHLADLGEWAMPFLTTKNK